MYSKPAYYIGSSQLCESLGLIDTGNEILAFSYLRCLEIADFIRKFLLQVVTFQFSYFFVGFMKLKNMRIVIPHSRTIVLPGCFLQLMLQLQRVTVITKHE